jgi:hypothetical protein
MQPEQSQKLMAHQLSSNIDDSSTALNNNEKVHVKTAGVSCE